MRINEDYLDDDISTEKTFDLSKKITEDVPEIEQRLRDIDFFVYYDWPTYKKVIKFLREHYGLICNWMYSENADYGEPAWLYQVYSQKDGKDARSEWRFEMTENVFDDWKKFYKEHPELDGDDEWEVIISAIDEMITRVENLDF